METTEASNKKKHPYACARSSVSRETKNQRRIGKREPPPSLSNNSHIKNKTKRAKLATHETQNRGGREGRNKSAHPHPHINYCSVDELTAAILPRGARRRPVKPPVVIEVLDFERALVLGNVRPHVVRHEGQEGVDDGSFAGLGEVPREPLENLGGVCSFVFLRFR